MVAGRSNKVCLHAVCGVCIAWCLSARPASAWADDVGSSLIDEAREQLTTQQHGVARGTQFSHFTLLGSAHHLAGPAPRMCRLAILNAAGVARTEVTAELRLLCFDADGKPVVIKVEGYRRTTPDAYETAFWWFAGPHADQIEPRNSGQARPHNAYVRVSMYGTAVFEALATREGPDALHQADGETYWYQDEDLVVTLPASGEGLADESAGDDLPAENDADESSQADSAAIDWESLSTQAQQAKQLYDASVAVACRDGQVARRSALDASEAGIAAAGEELRVALREAFRAALDADEFDEATRLKNALQALVAHPADDLAEQLSDAELTFSTGNARRAMATYRQQLDVVGGVFARQCQAADQTCQTEMTAAREHLMAELAVAYRSAMDDDQLTVALGLKEAMAALRDGGAGRLEAGEPQVADGGQEEVVYLDTPRPERWVRMMFQKYRDQIVEIDGEYHDIGEDRLIKPRLVSAATKGTWVYVTGARVHEVLGPTEMVVRIPAQAFKTREWRYGQMIDVYEAHPPQFIVVETDTSGYGETHRFAGGLIVLDDPGGRRPRVRPYEPLSREQFVEAINSGLRLVSYSYNRRRQVIQRPEE